MSLMLCRQEHVEQPFFMDVLGLHIYTSQELCYVIYHHPLLVLEDFVDSHLMDFIRNELDMPYLASRLEKWKKSNENQDELLIIILQECFYYRPSEVNDFRQHIINLRKKHPADYNKAKADYFFEMKQYGRAIPIYEKSLEFPKDHFVGDEFLGKIWCNMGSCYARMFQAEKALKAFEKAYFYLKDESIIQKMYYMTVLNPRVRLKEKYQTLMEEEKKREWDGELEQAREKAGASKEIKELDRLFEKDLVKRTNGAAEMIRQWKREYRNMI
ncbi:tetratricopeptide repeat protein [Lachnospiraceae bacterium 62-35]